MFTFECLALKVPVHWLPGTIRSILDGTLGDSNEGVPKPTSSPWHRMDGLFTRCEGQFRQEYPPLDPEVKGIRVT
jgi:hypothetical protein